MVCWQNAKLSELSLRMIYCELRKTVQQIVTSVMKENIKLRTI